ncbi:amidohydrolase family protein [Catenulispora rubra]|uniref:amidohydrolase family protein n=1 Tax=Catenulispora rubra TaxID=280293 RepID=UPI001891FA80|nr:amidohydrolase family protein [Catenulispora rubra]
MSSLLIRDAEVEGTRCDVRTRHGLVVEIGDRLRPAGDDDVLDAAGGALLPGLTDHHIHLFATAGDLASAACSPSQARTPAQLAETLREATPDYAGWVRGVRYHESVAGDLDSARLDALRDNVPVRIQHRSGALWMLNSRAAEAVGLETADHPGIERDGEGHATGRLWRADDWLRWRLPHSEPPSLAQVGHLLAGYGVTAVTDATPDLSPETVSAIAEAMASSDIPQRVQLLGMPLDTAPPPEHGPTAGPWKIVLADSGLPAFDELVDTITAAHDNGRPVAVHTVTRESLILLIAAFEQAGSLPGDRLEHAALVPAELIPAIRRRGLRVVTQPGFIADRGDDYLRDVPRADHGDLYRCASLSAARVPLALSSDAPYGPLDPWSVMRAATLRLTPAGETLSRAECLTAAESLHAYLSPAANPGGKGPGVRVGASADLVLLHTPLSEALACLDAGLVRSTIMNGQPVTSS